MQIRKNWFTALALFLFELGMLYCLICGIGGLGEGAEFPYYIRARLLLIMAGVVAVAVFAAMVGARLRIERLNTAHPRLCLSVEWVVALVVLAAGLAIRIWWVRTVPMAPTSDFKTYYEVAQLLNRGALIEEGEAYCEYISVFPHVLGYSAVLAFVFRVFGESVAVGQMFNIILAVGCCFVIWRIARLLTGRIAALIVLAVATFWPSTIMYNNFLAAEYLFSFLLYSCMWLGIHLGIRTQEQIEEPGTAVFLHGVLGVLLACAAAVCPMALLLLISLLICMVPARMSIPPRPRNDLSVALRILEKGWLRALIMLACYMLASSFINMRISYTIDRELPSGMVSMGHTLLIGLNQESYGGWNEGDSLYLNQLLDETGSAEETQKICLDAALQRLKADPRSLLNLFVHKYEILWGNDDYGSTWNLIILTEQNGLTASLEAALYKWRDYNDIWYFVMLFLSAIGALYMMKGKGSWSYLLVLLFCGTVAMHLLAETQNRYHFHCLYDFAAMAGIGLHELYQDMRNRVILADADRARRKAWKAEEARAMQSIRDAEQYAQEKLEECMDGYFDMESALQSGHVKITVSDRVEKAALAQDAEQPTPQTDESPTPEGEGTPDA